MPEEPFISINGKPLTQAEAMTLRVALSVYLDQLNSDASALGEDVIGKTLRDNYLAAGRSIGEKMRTS